MKKKAEKKSIKIRAWAILNHEGNSLIGDVVENGEYVFGAATFTEKRAREYVERSNERWDEEKTVIPCTITYELP